MVPFSTKHSTDGKLFLAWSQTRKPLFTSRTVNLFVFSLEGTDQNLGFLVMSQTVLLKKGIILLHYMLLLLKTSILFTII